MSSLKTIGMIMAEEINSIKKTTSPINIRFKIFILSFFQNKITQINKVKDKPEQNTSAQNPPC